MNSTLITLLLSLCPLSSSKSLSKPEIQSRILTLNSTSRGTRHQSLRCQLLRKILNLLLHLCLWKAKSNQSYQMCIHLCKIGRALRKSEAKQPRIGLLVQHSRRVQNVPMPYMIIYRSLHLCLLAPTKRLWSHSVKWIGRSSGCRRPMFLATHFRNNKRIIIGMTMRLSC